MHDLIVIGGGPAGYLAAERASHAGLSVLLFEKENLGGVCLNEGCIPSKALLYSAKLYDGAVHGDKYGVYVKEKDITFDHKAVVKRKDKVVSRLTGGIAAMLKGLGATVIKEAATIIGKNAEGFIVKAGDNQYTSRYLLLATGSQPIVPPIEGLRDAIDSGFAVTNRGILSLGDVPERLVVIGAGVSGLEMASYYNSAGSDVTIIEMLPTIGGAIDKDIAKILQGNYADKGVKFELQSKVVKVGADSVTYIKDGETHTAKADKVFLSIGRAAFTKGLGLENLGVAMDRVNIITDDKMRTNVPGLYAAGDVNGKYALAHTAYREAEVAVANIIAALKGGKGDTMRYECIPAAIYTNPEIGSVGYTEDNAKVVGLDVRCITVNMNFSGRYMAENEKGDGICKLVINKKNNVIIGCHMIGSYASEIIMSAAILVDNAYTLERAQKLIFPHPTVGEIIREGLFM